jgi:GAF domain
MEGFTILDYSTPLEADSSSQSVSSQLLLAQEQKRQLLDQLRFPGDDGGHSLAAWARKDLEATLQLLADRTQYITGASGAAIALRDGEEIICRASSGPSAPEIGSLLHVNSGLSGESIRTRQVRRCDDAGNDPRVNREICQSLGIAAFAVSPLLRDGQVIGIIEVFSGMPHSFEDRDILALRRMGEMVNTALDHVQNMRGEPAAAKPAAPSASGSAASLSSTTAKASETSENSKSKESATDKQKATLPNAAGLLDLQSQIKIAGLSADDIAGPKILSVQERQALNEHGIATCNSCGFPVSDGRTICIECEAAQPAQELPAALNAAEDAPPAPAELTFGQESNLDEPGIKQWFRSHKYLLGTVVVGGSALLFLLLR